jgi:hypothetical protein
MRAVLKQVGKQGTGVQSRLQRALGHAKFPSGDTAAFLTTQKWAMVSARYTLSMCLPTKLTFGSLEACDQIAVKRQMCTDGFGMQLGVRVAPVGQ